MASWAEPSGCPMLYQSQLQEPLLPELTCGWCCTCSGRADLREKKCCAKAAGREEWEMWEKQPYSHQGRCGRRAGGAPGPEQELTAAQERPTAEQAVLLQPTGTRWSRSPHAAHRAAADEALRSRSWATLPLPMGVHLWLLRVLRCLGCVWYPSYKSCGYSIPQKGRISVYILQSKLFCFCFRKEGFQ